MKITKRKLDKLEYYKGYLEGERLNEFFEEFEIKFAAGHWAAGDFLDRFASKGYFPELESDIISQMKRVSIAGIKGIEFHDVLFLNEKGDIDYERVDQIKSNLKILGLTPTTMNINLFTNPKWKMGGLTNPNREVREEAIRQALTAIEIAKKIGCEVISLWPGSDGWDYNFEVNYGKQYELFIESCNEINHEAMKNGIKFSIEAKLKEPREGNMIIPTTHLSALIVRIINERSGNKNMGVTIDYGHEQMYAVEPAATVYALHKLDIPIRNFHLNTAKLHSNDEDRVFGTGDIWRFVDFCYAVIDIGYNGWFTEDQFTYRMDPIKGMKLSRELFGNLFKKALMIYAKRDELEVARESGDQAKVIDVVKRIILTY